MKTLRSYVRGGWHEAKSGFVTLVDPSTEAPVARASSQGLDFRAVLEHARALGGPTLRAMTFAERGQVLRNMSKALRDKRDELMEISRSNSGTTAADGAFDIDGATGTLHYYANLAKGLGDAPLRADGEGTQLGRSEA
jgi:oxepin-CoA hydrolase/3-oxo-5,6-dehydrosuberyl-CoA semialdehyde dehydrogenase